LSYTHIVPLTIAAIAVILIIDALEARFESYITILTAWFCEFYGSSALRIQKLSKPEASALAACKFSS
jgi:hypothetical protein